MWARVLQGVGFAFLFIPINTVAFSDLPRAASGNAAAIINLSRNIGGSIGISVVTTGIARGEQAHQVTLIEHVTPESPFYHALLDRLVSTFIQGGLSASEAMRHAQAQVYLQVQQQAELLAFLDDFRWLALAFLALLPLVLLLKPLPRGSAAEPVHH
jgi:DHA2 family multidrug resistance protein